jgi:signal transduction histidine kinase/CheY-like chemotaxis protein
MPVPLRVLIVEDLEDDAILLLSELARGGWEITHQQVQTATAMAAAIDAFSWDIIISDYSMPRFSGIAALALARQKAVDLPFILVSGTVGEEVAVQAMKAGANDYLFKGNLKRLAPAVERELRDAEARRDARRVERELRKHEKQLAEAQRLARLGSLHVYIPSGAVIWSDEADRILGRQPGDPAISFEDFLARLHFDDCRVFLKELESRQVMQIARDCRLVSQAGTRYVHIRIDIVRDQSGAPLEAGGMIQDITERKLAEQELQKAHDDLALAKDNAEAANRAKDHFLAILSHELRTPLTPVLAIVSHLQTQHGLSEELKEDFASIRRNIEMEARLIDDLLDLTRIIRNKMELQSEAVDAHEVIRMALGVFQSEIDAKDLKVAIELQAAHHHVWADPARLQQVFMNVLSNALKFTSRGGTITIRSANDEKDRLQLSFTDNGIGIEPEVLSRLFGSFEQGERTITRRYGGLGLGLSIAKSLVDLHAGKIACVSEGRNRGACVTIELDTLQANAVRIPARAPESKSAPGALILEGTRVLLVEDHDDTRCVLMRLLNSFGCSVTSAGTVREALSLADKATFDLLVSDIGLPDGSGLDVMRHFKARYPTKGIALSGFGHNEDLRRSREAGFELHLVKPVNLTTLQQAIEKAIAFPDRLNFNANSVNPAR